jgi:hypothetical protein
MGVNAYSIRRLMGCFWITGFFIVVIDYASVRCPVSGQAETMALIVQISVLFLLRSSDNNKNLLF